MDGAAGSQNRRFREIFSMLMALFAISIPVPNLQRTPMRATRCPAKLAALPFCIAQDVYLYWLAVGFAAQAILLVKHPLAAGPNLQVCWPAPFCSRRYLQSGCTKQFLVSILSEGGSRRASVPPAPRKIASSAASRALSAPASSSAIVSPYMAACLRKECSYCAAWSATDRIAHAAEFVVIFSMNRGIFWHSLQRISSFGDCLRSLRRSQLALQHLWRGRPRRAGISACARSHGSMWFLAKNLMSAGNHRCTGGAYLGHYLCVGSSARSGCDANLHGIVDGLCRGHESGHWNHAIDPGAPPFRAGTGKTPTRPVPPIAAARCWFLQCCSAAYCCRFRGYRIELFRLPWLALWVSARLPSRRFLPMRSC